MASGFGRKGGQAARSISNVPSGPTAAMRPVERDDGLSPAARAFLASERLRQETEPSPAHASTAEIYGGDEYATKLAETIVNIKAADEEEA